MTRQYWIVMKLDPATDETDLRRVLANKLKGIYEIKVTRLYAHNYKPRYIVAVIKPEDAVTVQESFDVIDKSFEFFYEGKSVRDVVGS